LIINVSLLEIFMEKIITVIDPVRDLTIHQVRGRVSAVEIIACLDDYYNGRKITRNTLWDFSETDLGGVSSADIRRILEVVGKYGKARQGGKTALVLIGELEYGLGRMFSSLGELENIPFAVSCFRERARAEEWLS